MNDLIILEGIVKSQIKGDDFKVFIKEYDKEVICRLSGKMRQNKIKVFLGDTVVCEFTPYNLDLGRIIYRK